ncbi:MAG: hypothetical protein ACQEQF_10980 [Bacillota bacterium]
MNKIKGHKKTDKAIILDQQLIDDRPKIILDVPIINSKVSFLKFPFVIGSAIILLLILMFQLLNMLNFITILSSLFIGSVIIIIFGSTGSGKRSFMKNIIIKRRYKKNKKNYVFKYKKGRK